MRRDRSFAATTMLAPSAAARSAMAWPMPREAPVMNSVRVGELAHQRSRLSGRATETLQSPWSRCSSGVSSSLQCDRPFDEYVNIITHRHVRHHFGRVMQRPGGKVRGIAGDFAHRLLAQTNEPGD